MNYRHIFSRSMYRAIAAFVMLGGMSVALDSCQSEEATYTVTVPILSDSEGMMAYLMDYDTSELLDSTIVTNSRAVFNGSVESPKYIRVLVDHQRLGQMILEKGSLTFSKATGNAIGGELNERLNAITKKEKELQSAVQLLDKADSTYNEKFRRLTFSIDSLYEHSLSDNANNPIGYRMFINSAYELDSDSLEALLVRYPQFTSTQRVARLREAFKKKEETSRGHKYKDFIVTYNNKKQRLGDYVGVDGKYTLVEFWAGWCKPCIREMETVKKLYEKYGPDGNGQLNVVGVAVWDAPDNTLRAINDNALPWPQIINAQSIPTDMYGISGVPSIMLISPDGTIVLRDLLGDELIESVDAILTPQSEVEA